MIFKTKNGHHVRFGSGDVLMSNMRWPGNDAFTMIGFSNHEPPGEIGARASEPPQDEPVVVLEFTKPESIDALIASLNELKNGWSTPQYVGPLDSDLLSQEKEAGQ